MATKPTKPAVQPTEKPASTAKAMQAQSQRGAESEARLATTLRSMSGYEYNLELAKSVVEALIDPDVPDVFIEVPCPVKGSRRFLHTAYIKEIDIRGL